MTATVPKKKPTARKAAATKATAKKAAPKKAAPRKKAQTEADTIEKVNEARERVRDAARAALGIGGSQDAPPLREGLRLSGVGWYPLIALSVLVIVDELQGYAFFVLGPEMSATLGIGKGALAGLSTLKILAITLATLPTAAYIQKRGRRGLLSIVNAFAWSALTLLTGLVSGAAGLAGVLLADGATTGTVRATHTPLLMDTHAPSVRVRVLSVYRGADAFGNIAAPLAVAALTAMLGFTWRGVFIILGLVSLAAAVVSVGLRDPGVGKWDTAKVREAVAGHETTTDDIRLGFFEVCRRLFLIPTVKRILTASAVLGMFTVPLNTFFFFFLEQRWGLGPGGRGLFFAVLPVFAIAAFAAMGKRGEALFQRDPAAFVRASAVVLAIGAVLLPLSVYSPVLGGLVVMFGLSFACFGLLGIALTMTILSIVPASMRPHAAALAGIFTAAVGGFGGVLLLSGVEAVLGSTGAIGFLVVPGLISALVLRTAARTVDADFDRMVDELVEDEELNVLRSQGHHLPLLSCRGIDFSYGRLQVLFGVDFTVDDGEMVALLGTNGAGKSTLLRVVSGVGLPSKGTVRLDGADVTYLDAERRVERGITQIPGGKAVFGPMTVADNLRVYGFSHGRNRGAIESGIEESFAAFPRLAERRDQLASTLSGGEQQMLALSKALIVKPRLLLIDELSLGLAPKVVGELLEMVRRINAAGTAVVLVEQSVNIALSAVEHAYFMEKGEIRFDGAAKTLLGRDDLLRSVFLEGATRGMTK
ncbi:MAG: branched-chain amino acid transport system ATP-binding protein livF [Actinomycetota bacterium]|jgi:ABC-type branched-subunit amino acid transport system ATPase component/MFS family permease